MHGGVDVREQGRLERQLVGGVEALDARLGAVEEVEEEPLGRVRIGVRELTAVRAGEVVRAARGRDEPREPVLVVRDRVLRGEDDELARRGVE